MRQGLFDGIVQWQLEWKGKPAKLPVYYYDDTSITLIHTADTREVRRRLPHPAMRPVELRPGRAVVAFTAFEYRKTDIDPYNEFSIAFLIRFGCRPLPGLSLLRSLWSRSFTAYVWQLPVTTEAARAPGVELYGYPKFLADLRFERTQERISCRMAHDGAEVLTVRGPVLPTAPGPRVRYRTYSVKNGLPLVANVLIDPTAYAERMMPKGAELSIGSGPIADELRALRLSPTPFAYQYAPQMQAILFAPRNLVDR